MSTATQRVKADFRELASLHLDFAQSQWRAYGTNLRWGFFMGYAGLFLLAFAIVRLLDGLALRMAAAESTAIDAALMSGGLLLAAGLLLIILSSIFLKKTKEATQRVFREIGEDVQWMKRML